MNLGTINFAAIGPAFPNGAGQAGQPTLEPQAGLFLYAQPDDSVVAIIPISGVSLPCVVNIYRVNPDASYTYWQFSTAAVGGQNVLVESIVPLGTGNFFMVFTNGQSVFISAVNMRTNNTVPFILTQISAPIVPRCGGEIDGIVALYDNTRSYLAVGFYTQAGAGSIIHSQMIPVDPKTGQLGGQVIFGWCCNTNFGGDVFNQLTQTEPPGSTAEGAGFSSNGRNMVLTSGSTPWAITVQDVAINLGANTACDGTQGPTTSTVVGINNQTFSDGTPFSGTNGFLIDSCVDQLSGFHIFDGSVSMYNGSAEFNATASGAGIANFEQFNNMAITPRQVWSLVSLFTGQATLAIAPNPGFVSGNNVGLISEFWYAANYARPISIYGAFKA